MVCLQVPKTPPPSTIRPMGASSTIDSQWLLWCVLATSRCHFSAGSFSLFSFCPSRSRLSSFAASAWKPRDVGRSKGARVSPRISTVSLHRRRCCPSTSPHQLRATRHRNSTSGASRRKRSSTSRCGLSTQLQVSRERPRVFQLIPTWVFLGPTSAIVHIADKAENPNAYKTRSLPSKHKQRPASSIEDLDEMYSKVNFSKKLRNRMTNDEAAIIAFCRSKSQNLSQFTGSGPKGDDAIVIYDERTAL